MMKNFMTVAEKGKEICKLSVNAIISPQTWNSANIWGKIAANINSKKIEKARASAMKFCRRVSLSSGQRPRIFREIRFIPIAHSKSIIIIQLLLIKSINRDDKWKLNPDELWRLKRINDPDNCYLSRRTKSPVIETGDFFRRRCSFR